MLKWLKEVIGYWSGEVLGLIQIKDSPINYVNVIKDPEMRGYRGPDDMTGHVVKPLEYLNIYLVPDTTVSVKGWLESVFIEKPRGTRWEGYRQDEVIEAMNKSTWLNNYLAQWGEKLRIDSYPSPGWWTISSSWTCNAEPPVPTRDRWDFYQQVTQYLVGIHKNDSVVSLD